MVVVNLKVILLHDDFRQCLNIIYLPVYSPFLNPIEKVWADIKRELYKKYYKSVEDIIKIFRSEFYKIVDNKSYTENWLNKFFDINSW